MTIEQGSATVSRQAGRQAFSAWAGGNRLRCVGMLGLLAMYLLAGGCGQGDAGEPGQKVRPVRVLNQSEVQTLDPARISWQVDIRAADLLFDGLTQYHPKTLENMPCIAQRWDVSDDGRVYTFHLRRDATWSNGDPVTAHDFVWSWKRVLEPETAADYVYLMYIIMNAQRYNEGRACALEPAAKQAELKAKGKFVEPIAFDEVGIHAMDDHTLRVELIAALPYFLDLTSFITFKPVHRATIEKFTIRDAAGRIIDFDTDWYVQPGNLVCNGPYVLASWVQRQRMRFDRRADYYDVASIPSEHIEIIPVSDPSTALKMYEQGEADIMPFPPLRRVSQALMRLAEQGRRDDVHVEMKFGTYFYRLNTRREPFDDPRVRLAFSRAIDREMLTRNLCWLGEKPAESLVPPGVRGYVSPKMAGFDPEAARKLLAEAGYPGGKGLPVIEIMFNKEASHQAIAESIKDMWQRHLGARVELLSIDRGTLRQKMQSLDYSVSRAGWYGDYNDPMTFLDMWITAPEGGGGNNDTGFGNPEYDRLIQQAMRESDKKRRDEMLHRAEEILVVEHMPIIPLYYYSDMYLFRPAVKGFWPNRMGINPLRWVEVVGG